jgi:hypothetical protein
MYIHVIWSTIIDVSEEPAAIFFRVEQYPVLGKQSCCKEGGIKAGAMRKPMGGIHRGTQAYSLRSYRFTINSGTFFPFKSSLAAFL